MSVTPLHTYPLPGRGKTAVRFDLRFQHDKCRRITLHLLVYMISQRTGLVGFHCCCGLGEELFDLLRVISNHVLASFFHMTYSSSPAGLGRDDGDDVDGHDG